eukprot:CAMPEP_0119123772 /NCGR_PEP_ID=MMETSP1310-20130426/3610_1 /TAXON_ID=464262 /ORGANISM="Genus nov. species nov., Strain RCC2339" /LENGTH=346 /DNA_ID=CAMNT_0007113635 /DNA_START=136 /DNA_END=1176 /DNA_ORIENTATION=-
MGGEGAASHSDEKGDILHVRFHGHPLKEADVVVVMVHGLCGSGGNYCKVIPHLLRLFEADGHKASILCPDLMGHGHSSTNVHCKYSYECFSKSLCHTLRHIDHFPPRFHLVGFSLGAAVSLRFFSMHTLAVSSLTLLATPGYSTFEEYQHSIAKLTAHESFSTLKLQVFSSDLLSLVANSILCAHRYWTVPLIYYAWGGAMQDKGLPYSVVEDAFKYCFFGARSAFHLVSSQCSYEIARALGKFLRTFAKGEKGGKRILLLDGDSDVTVPHHHTKRLFDHICYQESSADFGVECGADGECITTHCGKAVHSVRFQLVPGGPHLMLFTQETEVSQLIYDNIKIKTTV